MVTPSDDTPSMRTMNWIIGSILLDPSLGTFPLFFLSLLTQPEENGASKYSDDFTIKLLQLYFY